MSLKRLNFDPNDHVPDRNVDHSMLTRSLAGIVTLLLFFVTLVVSSYVVSKGRLARFFGGRLIGELGVFDWVVIVVGGVVLPLLLYVVVNQYSPLGLRRWGVVAFGSWAVMVQFLSMFVLMMTASYCLLRMRLCVRTGGVVKRVNGWVWLPVLSSVLSMLCIGLSAYDYGWLAEVSYVCLAYPVGFLLVKGFKAWISNERMISVSALNRGMVVILILILVCSAFLVKFYYADEKRWIREDTLFTLNPEHLGEDSRSYRTAQQMRKELRERLEIIR